ncbi:MAG: adenylate/guanylate cyclase domain-containing protein [Flavobacteriales bacterium]
MLLGSMAGAQNTDSLRAVWNDPGRPDTVRLQAMENLIWDAYVYVQPDSAFLLAEEMATFAERGANPGWQAKAFDLQAASWYIRGEAAKALEFYQRALVIHRHTGNKDAEAGCEGNLGLMSSILGDHTKALAHLERALALDEELGNRKGMANVHLSLGRLCMDQGDYTSAVEHYSGSLSLAEADSNLTGMANALGNLGILSAEQQDYAQGIAYMQRSIALFERLGDKNGFAVALGNLGGMYTERGDYDKALDCQQRRMSIAQEVGDLHGVAVALNNMAEIHGKKKEHREAIGLFDRAADIARRIEDPLTLSYSQVGLASAYASLGEHRTAARFGEDALNNAHTIGNVVAERDAAQALHLAYKELGDGDRALAMHERYVQLRDSILSTDNQRAVLRQEYQYNYDKKALADSLVHEQEQHAAELAHQEQLASEKNRRNMMGLGGGALAIMAIGLYTRLRYVRRTRDIISREKDRSETLLLNILPAEVAEELKEKGSADAKQFDQATILFTDFKGFTSISEKLSPAQLVEELNVCFKAFDKIITDRGIEKIKTIGDAYMCAGGLPDPETSSPVEVVLAALEMQAFMVERKAQRDATGTPAFEMRVGIHTGPVVAGIVGVKKFAYDIWGDTVNIASRMESSGEVGQVNISEITYALVKAEPGLTFTVRGKVQAKGKGELEMYFVSSAPSKSAPEA